MKKPATLDIKIPCKCCEGTGQVRLGSVLAETLAELRSQPGRINAVSLANRMGVRNDTMCNRLKTLESKGLASCERNGREKLWRAAERPGEET